MSVEVTLGRGAATHPTRIADRPRLTAAAIRRGLRAAEFFVVYQPQVEVGTRSIRGVEALVRWDHPQLGELRPGAFLPVAEESATVVALDDYVLQRACRDLSRWRDEGVADLRVAVNLSVRSIEDPGLVARIADCRTRYHVPPGQLEVEVTESAAVRDGVRVTEALERLRDAGVLVALDDFGTGYSMLDRLRTLPFDALKIDRSFVAGLNTESGPQLLLAAIALGHGLGLRVVAEGVEEQAELDFLTRHRCDEAQGYLLGRPAPANDVSRSLRRRPRTLKKPQGNVLAPFGRSSEGLERLVRPLLSELARLTELESTYLTFIDSEAGTQMIVFARNAGELEIGEGLQVPWKDTVCKRSLESGVRCTSDVASTFGDSAAGRELGLRTYAGVPVLRDDGTVWGTLCGASRYHRSVGEPTLAVMEAFARLVVHQLELVNWRLSAA